MEFSCGNANFSAHAKLTTICELRGAIMHDNRTVDVMLEIISHFLTVSHDGFGVVGNEDELG